MINLGWFDPVESKIILVYRRKGERQEHDFLGGVALLNQDRNSLTWLKRGELPLKEGRLVLTNIPVIGIGGKRNQQPRRAQEFLDSNPEFQGALLFYPGVGGWDLGEGVLILTSHETLSGRRVSGGQPEVQLTNFRWLDDGRRVADRVKMLHGKVLEVIETVEQETMPEEIVQGIAGRFFPHPLYNTIRRIVIELSELEMRRVVFSGETTRDISEVINQKIAEIFRDMNVKCVREIPKDFSITADQVAPELISQRDTLGTVEIPGLGRRLVHKDYARMLAKKILFVEFSLNEIQQIKGWPPDVWPVLKELPGGVDQVNSDLGKALDAPDEVERIQKIKSHLGRKWREFKKNDQPQDKRIENPLMADPPPTPEPVIWGNDLVTGEKFISYAALTFGQYGTGDPSSSQWSIRWFDDKNEAARTDAHARHIAQQFMTARQLEEELTSGAEVRMLPVKMPVAFVPFNPTLVDIMERLGFTAEEFRIEGKGPISVCVSPESGYESEISGRWVVLKRAQYADRWWKKDGEMLVVFENTTTHHLVKDPGDSVAGQMGVSQDNIHAVRDWIEIEKKKTEEEYRAQVWDFFYGLQEQPAYACLSKQAQAKLVAAVDSYGVPDLQKIADELRAEWAKAEMLLRKVDSGEILMNFGGHFRVMGATGNRQYWVITADGTERNPDEVNYRGRYTSEGEKKWRLVGPNELVISWEKANTAAPHEFIVAKKPISGCTQEQLETVKRLEREISERFYGTTGISGRISPEIANGWGLCQNLQPESNQPAQTTGAETREASVGEPQKKIQWENLGKGWWKCPKGHTAKSKSGEPTVCEFCR